MGRTNLGPTNNPGGARWCEDHTRLECTKNRNRGRGQCHKMAIRGTDACDMHSGIKREVARAQGEARLLVTAWSPQGEGKLDAGMAVLSVLQMTYLRLGMYAELLRQQVAVQGQKAGSPSVDQDPDTSGLIGFRYGAAGKDGVIYVQSEEVRALVNLEASERDRVVKYAKVAHDMGISSRITALAERWGDVIAARVLLILDGLDLNRTQTGLVPALLDQHLSSVDLDQLALEGEKDSKGGK